MLPKKRPSLKLQHSNTNNPSCAMQYPEPRIYFIATGFILLGLIVLGFFEKYNNRIHQFCAILDPSTTPKKKCKKLTQKIQ
jgi:hypothetical protein